MTGKWVSDGSPEIIVSGDSAKIECQLGERGGNVYNGLWKENEEGVKTGTHYWKMTLTGLEKSGIFVGVTDLEKFKKGWGLRALLYGGPGNLSNGGALITSAYGPSIKSDTTIGILVVFEGSNLKIYFDVNGTPLGQAFDLPATTLKGVFPVAHFSGKGNVTIVKSSEIPTNLTRQEPVYEGIEGNWKCSDFNGQPTPTSVTASIFKNKRDGGKTYAVHLKVVNGINFNLSHDAEGGTWKTTGGMSTLMSSSPELMELENQMKTLASSPSRIEVEDGVLVLDSATANSTSKWTRYSVAKSAVTENPFK